MLLKFLIITLKILVVYCIFFLPLVYEKILLFKEKGGEHEGAFPFLLVYC